MSDGARGIGAIIGACVIWGLSPIFYAQLARVPPLDILAHRTIWSLTFFLVLLAWQGRLRDLGSLRQGPVLRRLVGSGALISSNWFLFILATQIGQVTEASLGYFIFPLVAVLLGRVLLGEWLGPAQWAAVGLAAVAVATLSVGLGATPWLSLGIAATFGGYGAIKRSVAAGPVLSVTAEVALLTPLAALWLILAAARVPGLGTLLLLMASGPVTAVPLVLFSYAARRVRLSTLGLVQYLNPTLQFACAALVFGEPVTLWHRIAFGGIWLALTIYSADSMRRERASRRRAIAPSTSSTRVT